MMNPNRSTKGWVAGVLLVLAISFLSGGAALADVTGSFATTIGVSLPEDVQTVTEQEVLAFDVQNALNLTIVISGLSTTVHSHFGIAGVEDVMLAYAATLGALDLNGTFVFGRFAATCASVDGPRCDRLANNPFPVNDDLLFVKKRVKTTISLGGISLQNLAMFEDVNFPETQAQVTHQTDDQVFAFGDVLTLTGETPSGVSIEASTGICAERSPNVIKKHSFPFEVNPHCAGDSVEGQVQSPSQKPNLAFDFERVAIRAVPVSSGLTTSTTILCVKVTRCELTHTLDLSSMGPIPLSVEIVVSDLFALTLDAFTVTANTGPGTLAIVFNSFGMIELVSLDLTTTLNPDTNPATFAIDSSFQPGVGLTEADVTLTIQRADVDFGLSALFDGGPPATFSEVRFEVGAALGAVNVDTSATFGAFEFESWTTTFTINF